jgi:multifunctional methyltransferase subunit TRM112
MLKCNVKGVSNGFPLKIEVEKKEIQETDFNAEFIKNFIPKLEWGALVEAAKAFGEPDTDLPEEYNEAMAEDEEFLKKLHKVLLEIHLVDGNLVCPESGRKFPVKDGIPNMLLNEDEV